MAKEFSISERGRILAFVREVIACELASSDLPEAPDIPGLNELRSCFVTLHDCEGNLRGCIGNIEPFEPLSENLVRNSINAAFSDPRFPPLEMEELGETKIEVSILTQLELIADPTRFRVGVDGIILRQGKRGAVFLPQVAQEQGWNQVTTLEYLSQKAGLAADGWQHTETTFFVFQAEVFGE
ncbi:MAG: AmmeMemoRadiSam system protein A [Victivallales bacterium]|jgi:AmmeMemoRadiSam system protein A|nr:AmmeMemoRadiSam system protein A [Victivallales bacterium]